MATAQNIINRAFRLARIIAAGENPSAGDAADALEALNAMLADWSGSEARLQYQYSPQTYTPGVATTSFTIGPTGQLVIPRPFAISNPFTRVGGYDYPIELIGEADYLAITNKALNSGYPQWAFYNAATPNATLYLWPGAQAGQTITFDSQDTLGVLTLATTLGVPANYERALAYNLAVEIAPEYGKEVMPDVKRIAALSKRGIKIANKSVPTLSTDTSALASAGSGSFNILSNR